VARRRTNSVEPEWSRWGSSAPERRDADLFFASLLGLPAPGPERRGRESDRPRYRAPDRFVDIPESDDEAPEAFSPVEDADEQDATCPAPSGSACAHFFKGSEYLRYNIANDTRDVGPRLVCQAWRMDAPFHGNLDAAVNWGNGFAYFFKGAQYVRYNIATDRSDAGPRSIAAGWTALPADFQSGLDAVANWGNGFAYFFKGARYLKYRIADDTIAFGPAPIAGNWAALPAAFQSGVKAVVNWTHPTDLAALLRRSGVTVNEIAGWQTRSSTGAGGCFTPVGVMIHHTVSLGAAALADITTNIKANFFVNRAGVVSVVSGRRANHAGEGAQQVLDDTAAGIAPTGTAVARGLVDGPIGNGHYYGFENENAGDGVMPWPAVQLLAIARSAAALCQRHGWSEKRVISHAEWTRRKIDPRGVDMDIFRAVVRSFF